MYSTRKRKLALLVSASVLALAAACGGKDAVQAPLAGEAKLNIAYSALTVKAGDKVTLSANLQNANDPVTWSVTGPGSLSAASGLRTEYLASGKGAAQITAVAGPLNASVRVNVVTPEDCESITIHGTILNEDLQPIENQAVYVLGTPSTLTATDLQGQFTIPNVTPPYDLVMTEDALNRVFVYKGLTRPDPILYVFEQPDQTAQPNRTAILNGLVAGGDPTPLPGENRLIGFSSPELRMGFDLDSQNFDTALPAIPGPYSLDVAWNGPVATTGTLVAVESHPDTSGAPIAWWYAAQPDVTLLSPQTLTGPTLDLMPVSAVNTEGTISLPPIYTVTAKTIALSLEGGVFFPAFFDFFSLDQQTNFKYVVPDVHGASTQVCVSALDTVFPGASATCIDALKPETSDAKITIVAAPQPFAPANFANAVNLDTLFAWSPFQGGIHNLRLLPENPADPTYYVFTASNLTTIPDVSPGTGLGFPSGSGHPYLWFVAGYGPFTDMDAFTAGVPAATFLAIPPSTVGQILPPPVPNSTTAVGGPYVFTPE